MSDCEDDVAIVEDTAVPPISNQEHFQEDRSLHDCDCVNTIHFKEQMGKFDLLCRTDRSHGTQPVDPEDPAQINKTKNRYQNVVPFRENRVILQSSGCDTDYINASPVDGDNVRFISTQAPLPITIADFWVMVWEKKAPVIVMLTQFIENLMQKAHLYWPVQENTPCEFGDGIVRVTLLSQNTYESVIVRNFCVEMAAGKHKVQHIMYNEWPDHGVPISSCGIRQIMSRTRRVVKGSLRRNHDVGPIIVHCSAGIGRSGTYIAASLLDEQLQRGKSLLDLDLVEMITAMRKDRAGMVQTKEQFEFLYDVLRERERYWNRINTDLPEFPDDVDDQGRELRGPTLLR
jgi:protein tyrosine phosphatase